MEAQTSLIHDNVHSSSPSGSRAAWQHPIHAIDQQAHLNVPISSLDGRLSHPGDTFSSSDLFVAISWSSASPSKQTFQNISARTYKLFGLLQGCRQSELFADRDLQNSQELVHRTQVEFHRVDASFQRPTTNTPTPTSPVATAAFNQFESSHENSESPPWIAVGTSAGLRSSAEVDFVSSDDDDLLSKPSVWALSPKHRRSPFKSPPPAELNVQSPFRIQSPPVSARTVSNGSCEAARRLDFTADDSITAEKDAEAQRPDVQATVIMPSAKRPVDVHQLARSAESPKPIST